MRNIAKSALTLVAACLVFTSCGYAVTGGKPGGIFTAGAGARPLGMGSAYTAMGHDAFGIYYNPAGLGMLPNPNISFMHAALFESATYDYIGYARNYSKVPGGWGVSVLRTSVGGVEGRDENNNPIGAVSYSELGVMFGTGFKGLVLPKLSMGASLKVLSRSMSGVNSADKLIGMDVGFQYGTLLWDKLTAGLVIQNALAMASGDTSDKLPLTITPGIAVTPFRSVLFTLDMFSMSALRTGVEYSPSFWAVRAGYDRENISFGAGVKILKSWELDLAILRNSDLGMSQRISLGYWFGSKNKESKTVEYSKDYLGEYTGNIKAKKYIEALEALQRAIAMQPELSKTMWAERESRLNQIVTELQLNGNTVKQKELSDDGTASEVALESINAYLDGKDIKSFILAHAALGEDSQNSTIESLLNTLSKITGGKIDKKQIMPKRSLLKNKVSQAEEAFFGKRYELSIKQLTEALALDDTNVEVWKMLGSCYYAIGDFTKAKECYAKGLELDPNNKSIKAFMESKGWIKK